MDVRAGRRPRPDQDSPRHRRAVDRRRGHSPRSVLSMVAGRLRRSRRAERVDAHFLEGPARCPDSASTTAE